MVDHREAIADAPALDAPIAAWSDWAEKWFPYTVEAFMKLTNTLPDHRPPPQDPRELDDIAGQPDRNTAAFLSHLWFDIREHERRRRMAATRMPSVQRELDRNDLDEAICG